MPNTFVNDLLVNQLNDQTNIRDSIFNMNAQRVRKMVSLRIFRLNLFWFKNNDGTTLQLIFKILKLLTLIIKKL